MCIAIDVRTSTLFMSASMLASIEKIHPSPTALVLELLRMWYNKMTTSTTQEPLREALIKAVGLG